MYALKNRIFKVFSNESELVKSDDIENVHDVVFRTKLYYSAIVHSRCGIRLLILFVVRRYKSANNENYCLNLPKELNNFEEY